ncbi:MAG: hypothetical protein A2169_13160 [Deltaproteobacteria bacterium RBG_13_47_9]|nr:MAG: hypothetical protein A2169_13160 [Deltaproteobacteria bacterium RBG_13_47_9]
MKRLPSSNFFLFLFSLFICFESYRINLGTLSSPGPGLYPFGAGLILGVLSLVQIFKSHFDGDEPVEIIKGKILKIPLVLFILIIYGIVLEQVGFLITTFGLLIFLLKIIVPQRWGRAFIAALLSTIVCYLIFEVWLKTQLPRGFLNF